MEEIVDKELLNRRVQAILLGSFSVIAGLVALVGIYGLIAYDVRRRTSRENRPSLALVQRLEILRDCL
ncbi:MAG: hypothetical protein U5J83_02895 [Bryobacterales bacterium]|nr:hypothetical protein [Bryobacterales bacterium]